MRKKREMTVNGVPVTSAQATAAGQVLERANFSMRDVIAALIQAGFPVAEADRAADRVLQRERRAGRIAVVGRKGSSVRWSCKAPC